MKKVLSPLFITFFFSILSCTTNTDSWIRINQLGYRPGDIKVAVFISTKEQNLKNFKIIDASTGKVVMTNTSLIKAEPLDQFVSCYRLNFSELKKDGTYRLTAGNSVSPDFKISKDIYDGTADYLLNYMRQQRCGFNPFLNDSCHTSDGYIVYGKPDDSAHIDVTGGWHDAADYLQYVATSANAAYQMLFSYSENPASFGDKFMPNGLYGSDGIPDILNESKWGLDWLLKMNPSPGIMYNQIADDRDHIGFRFPNYDTAKYGKGPERPVYFCTGEPQGLVKYKNRTTGIASTAGKFSSSFARGAIVFRKTKPQYSKILKSKAIEAFDHGLKNPGVCQTAPGSAPYFYEEDNWVDDMELAAIELYNLTGEPKYYDYALEFGRKELVTPWIGSDTARHYQWYPFVNMGHPGIALLQKNKNQNEFAGYMKQGLELTSIKAKKNPFYIGVPFIWCSNNLVSSILTQFHLYNEITGDDAFAELEAAHRDWLFGCNPWGTSMVVGLPENGDYPVDSHSSFVIKGKQVNGGLVDGPVYSSIFRSHSKYVALKKEDQYAGFQTKMANYHDDAGDYTSNECTMDGTACLVYYLSALSSSSGNIYVNKNALISKGAVVRMDTTRKEVWLCFTAHDFADGFETVTRTLNVHSIKASFFLTGDFCRTKTNEKIIKGLLSSGHYIGPHSDKHLLYCSWEKQDSLLVTKSEFISDINNNYEALNRFGISKNEASVFMPSYEWYNDTISDWANNCGLKIINISSGAGTNQDWTIPGQKPYYSSDLIMENLVKYEKEKGLNGYILLIHPGTDPRREDKFYLRLDSVLNFLEHKNYKILSFSEIN